MRSKITHTISKAPLPWLPISLAPKTGERILLFYPANTIFSGSIVVSGNWCLDACANRPAPYWDCDLSRSVGVRKLRVAQPTHWLAITDPSTSPSVSGSSGNVSAECAVTVFVRAVAALVKDGESVAGEPFDMPSDQAVDTLADLISDARAIIARREAT